MPKSNQRAIWEKGSKKTEPPSKRTEPKGITNKYHNAPHNHFPQGKTGYDPKIGGLN